MPTVTQETGWLLELNANALGGALTQDAPVGTTVLHLTDVVDFDEGGGTLHIGDDLLGYATTDPDTDTITLNGPLSTAVDVDEFVSVWDTENGKPAAELRALVEFVNANGDDDPVAATLTHSLAPQLALGPRDGRGETVVLEQYGPSWRVIDVLGKDLVLDISSSTANAPAAPTDLLLSAAVYESGGRNLSRVLATWAEVTTAVNGDDLTNLDHYMVQTKLGSPGAGDDWGGNHQVPAGTHEVTMSPFPVNQTVSVRVQGVNDLGIAGPWSEPASILTSDDDTPPAVPSAPTTSSRLGTIKIFWNGRNASGGVMEPDFDYVEVHASTVSGFTPTPGDTGTVIGRLYGPGYEIMSVGPTGYNTIWYFRFVAVDTSGNASAASARADNTVKPLVDVTNFPDDAMDVLYARTGHFINLTADNFSANLIEADFIDFGSLNGELITGLQIQTTATANRGVKLKNTGLEAYTSSGVRSFYVNATTGNVEILGTLKAGSSIEADLVSGGTFSGVTLIGADLYVSQMYPDVGDSNVNFYGGFNIMNGGGNPASLYVQGPLTTFGSASFGGAVSSPGAIATFAKLHLTDPNTGSGGVDVLWQTGSNQVVANTSSRRFKYGEEPLPIDLASAYALEPKRSHRHDSDDPDTWFVSFIAEDAVDLGLEPWVVRDEDGEVFSFSYTNWTVAQQAMLRDLHARITNLEEQAA